MIINIEKYKTCNPIIDFKEIMKINIAIECGVKKVICLSIDQIKSGQWLSFTDSDMIRFMMSLEDAVELVVFVFQNADEGKYYGQKSLTSKAGDLAQAINEWFNLQNEIKVIGTRHHE